MFLITNFMPTYRRYILTAYTYIHTYIHNIMLSIHHVHHFAKPGDVLEAMWFISHGKVSICSTSTFCFWAAMVSGDLTFYLPFFNLVIIMLGCPGVNIFPTQ